MNAVDVVFQIEATARSEYTKACDNHPTIHSNRFPSWSELGDAARVHWIRAATLMIKGEVSDARLVFMTTDQHKALKQLLEAVQLKHDSSDAWDYFAHGGWAGDQLLSLLKLGEPK